MDIITIVQAILPWAFPALVGAAAFLALLSGGYWIYRKKFRGQKRLTRGQVFSGFLLCGWLLVVLGLTSLSRGANYSGQINLDLFSGYISAWNNWSVTELQLILFNILMFAPLGFLLPLVWKRAEKVWVTLGLSLGVTAFIEVFQLATKTGIFELDDLFHNLLGSLAGYFCVMAVLTFTRERTFRFAPLAKALAIPALLGLGVGAAVLAYEAQPYGNMTILPAEPQDMSQVRILESWKTAGIGDSASVYKNKYAEGEEYLDKVRAGLAELEQLTFQGPARREDENLGYTGIDGEGTPFRLLFFFRTGEWSYTTFPENTARLTEETAKELRTRYEAWMKEMELLPENAVFSVQNGDTLRWDVAPGGEISGTDQPFQSGNVMIQLDESGALGSFYYQICWNEYAATEPILSAEEAYAQVKAGNFQQYLPFQPGDQLYVEECTLTYLYDTKGFYQPVYQFSGYINDQENTWSCMVPARTEK